ncbi:MAG: hypothetical protein AB7O98_12035 [Hyphomonadaceae bacterium]
MRFGFAAAVLALACASAPAFAQDGTTPAPAAPAVTATSQCGATPPAPTVPDGATADRAAMNTANEAYQAYGTAMQANLACRRDEVTALRAQAQALTDEYNRLNGELGATTQAMVAAAEAFNAR